MKNWKTRKTCPLCKGGLKRITNRNHLNLLTGAECTICCAVMYDNGIGYAPCKFMFYYSLNHKKKLYTLYNSKRKPIGKFYYKSMMVDHWHSLGGKSHRLLNRIYFGKKKK